MDNQYKDIQVMGCGNLLDAVNCGLVEDVSQAMRWKKRAREDRKDTVYRKGRKGTKFPTTMSDLAFDEQEVYEEEDDIDDEDEYEGDEEDDYL